MTACFEGTHPGRAKIESSGVLLLCDADSVAGTESADPYVGGCLDEIVVSYSLFTVRVVPQCREEELLCQSDGCSRP